MGKTLELVHFVQNSFIEPEITPADDTLPRNPNITPIDDTLRKDPSITPVDDTFRIPGITPVDDTLPWQKIPREF